MIKIKHVVFEKYENFRWYFVDTMNKKERYFISLNPKDFKYAIGGLFILLPPFSSSHIKGNWD